MKGFITAVCVAPLIVITDHEFPQMSVVTLGMNGAIIIMLVLAFWCGLITIKFD
jgi:hypothetical protein